MAVNLGINIQRSPNRINQQLREAGVIGKYPKLLLDFADNYYLANGGSKTLANAVTHARAGNATMTDGYGPELVTNGSFTNDISGWTAETGGNPVYDNGKLRITVTDSENKGAYQALSTESGKTYVVALNLVESDTGTLKLRIGTAVGDGTNSNETLSKGLHQVVFTATASTTYITFRPNSTVDGRTAVIDNVSVREMPVIKFAPHNLVDDSDDLTGLGSITGVTRTETVLTETTITDSHTINIGYVPIVGEKYTIACEVKLESGSRFVSFRGFGEGGSNKYPIFNLVNGTIEDSGDSFTDVSITDVGDGYYLLKASVIASLAFSWAVHMQNSTTSGSGGYEYTGDGTSAIAIRKIRQYRSDLGGMVDNPDKTGYDVDYVPTDNAIAYLPRIGHHVYNGSAWVNEGVLAESESRTNIIDYSDFSTNWATTNATKTDDDATGPDGKTSAIKLEGDSTVAAHNIKRGATSVDASSNYTFSVFAKKGTHDAIGLRIDKDDSGSGWGTFDLTNGYAKTGGGTPADIATIQDMGNGWFRCSITASTNADDTTINPHIHLMDDYASPATAWNASGKNVYLYGTQLEKGYTPSSLIPTIGSSVTRAAETFTIPSANLPWPTPQYIGSELVTNGTFDTDVSGWTADTDGTISYSSGTLLYTGTSTGPTFMTVEQLNLFTAGKVYRISLDLVTNSDSANAIRLRSNTTSEIGNMTATGTYEFTFVATGSDSYLRIGIVGGLAGESFSIDNVSVREINPLSVSIGMDGRITYADEGLTNTATLLYWQDDSNNFIRHRLRTDSTNVGELQIMQEANNVNDGKAFDYLEPNILVPYSYAARHGSTFLNLATDGVAQTANVTPTELADLSSIDLDLADDYMGTIGTFRIWDRDITDEGIKEATNPSLEPSLSLTFEGTGTNSFVVNDWSE